MDEKENFQNDVYQYMAKYAQTIYENEVSTSNALIQQSSQMQTAFSFMVAAVFMIAALVFQYATALPMWFLVSCFSTITGALLFSLLFAMIAQHHRKKEDYPDISDITAHIIANASLFATSAQRDKYIVDTYEVLQKSMKAVNLKRQKWIKCSMIFFYIALGLCAFWFVVSFIKIA